MPLAPVFAALALALPVPSSGQAELLFFEDFESGGSGWTATGKPEVLWHVSEAGECGAVTRMAVYNRSPAACDYGPGVASSGAILSPVFTLHGEHSIVVQYDYRQETDEGNGPCVEIVEEASGQAVTVIGCTCCADPFQYPDLARATGALPDPGAWSGKQARLRFSFKADSDRNTGFGCMVDNVRVVASGPAEVLYTEDFEEGGVGWTTTTEDPVDLGPPLWHVASPGECGAVTRVGAYNRAPAACDYATKGSNAGRLRSPLFRLGGAPPFTVEFVSLKRMDAHGDDGSLHLVDPTGSRRVSSGTFPDSATLQPLAFTIDPAGFWSFWSDMEARLEFAASADRKGNQGSGWMVDDIRVTNSGSLPPLPDLPRPVPAPAPVRELRLADRPGHEARLPFAVRIDPYRGASALTFVIPKTIALLDSRLESAIVLRESPWTTLRVLTLSVRR